MSQAQLLSASPSVSLPPVTYKGLPVCTTEMLAEAYGCTARHIKQNFANNRDRFVEGKHFVAITNGEIRDFALQVENFDLQISPKTRHLTLWLERGAARHAKMLNTDKAWDVFELLEETFFRVAKPAALASDAPLTPEQQCTLQNIVKAKVESLPEAQRKGRGLYPQIWSRFNNHFRIARYCQLPQCRLAEAVAYLVRLDIEPKPKALPQPEALSMPKPDTNREKFVRFLEKVEALRAQTDRTLRDLAVEGAALLDDDRFGTTRWNTSSIIHDWLLNVVPRPLEIRPDFEMARGLFAFLHDVENLLPLRWR